MRHDGCDAGGGGRLSGVRLGGDLLPVGQPPPLLLLEIQRPRPQGSHAQGGQMEWWTVADGRTDEGTISISFLIGSNAISSSGGSQISKGLLDEKN